MTTKTRYFVIASLLVLTVGLGTGLVAYYSGSVAVADAAAPDEIKFLPADAAVVAYAEVAEIMASPMRQKVRELMPMKPDGQQEFQNQTGINIETDIDRIVAAFVPSRSTTPASHPSAIVVARGRFDAVRIESLMREHGARVEIYKDQRMIVAPDDRSEGISVAFLEPGLVAVGSPALIKSSIDLKSGGASVLTNDDLMSRVSELRGGNAWAVGRFDALTQSPMFPQGVSQQMPSVAWVSATATIDSGVHGSVRAEARDEESANGLRDIIRGIVALARLQMSGQSNLQAFFQTLQLGGSGKNVTLAFDAPGELFDALGALTGHAPARP